MTKEKLQKKQQDKINQMISFIDQEASEKAKEIDDQTKQDCTIEKNERVETAKHKLREEYEEKNKQVEVEKRILKSDVLTAARMEVLGLQDEIMKKLKKECLKEIQNMVNDKPKYEAFLNSSLYQALDTLREKKVTVECRKEDSDYIKKIIPTVSEEFTKATKIKVTVKISEKHHLEGMGGIIATGLYDRIRVDNTLEERVELCYQEKIPELRSLLFPKN
eukprot:gene6553-10559_t